MDKRYNTIASQNTKLIHIIIWTDSYIEKLSPAASNNVLPTSSSIPASSLIFVELWDAASVMLWKGFLKISSKKLSIGIILCFSVK